MGNTLKQPVVFEVVGNHNVVSTYMPVGSLLCFSLEAYWTKWVFKPNKMFAFSEMYNFHSNEYYAWMYVYETLKSSICLFWRLCVYSIQMYLQFWIVYKNIWQVITVNNTRCHKNSHNLQQKLTRKKNTPFPTYRQDAQYLINTVAHIPINV